MSLRLRLFLILATVIAALLGAHAWLVRSLTHELIAEVDSVALSVGKQVATVFAELPVEVRAGVPPGQKIKVLHVVDRRPDAPKNAPKRTETVAGRAGEAEDRTDTGAVQRRRVHSQTYAYRIRTDDEKGGLDVGQTGKPGGPASGHVEEIEIRLEQGGRSRFLHLLGPDLRAQVPIPQLGLLATIEDFQRRMVLGSLGLLAVGLVAAGYVAHRVARPLVELRNAALAVGAGGLGQQAELRGADPEARQTLEAFNRMSLRLAELEQQNRRLAQERHLGEIGEIARGLAHSLRNPLNALGLSVEEMAARGAVDDGQEALTASARRQIRRLDRGIRSFLVLASQADGAPAEVDVGQLVCDVALEALQDQPGQIRIEVDVPRGLPTLRAVEAELRAIVQALVVNAVEASPPGGLVLVELRAGEVGGRLKLTVDDRGPGLAPLVRQRLFTPHVTTKPNGSGMGLFLAQRLVSGRYGGLVELLDRPDGGTRAVLDFGPRGLDEVSHVN
jgi:signal transduction histidine kinase